MLVTVTHRAARGFVQQTWLVASPRMIIMIGVEQSRDLDSF